MKRLLAALLIASSPALATVTDTVTEGRSILTGDGATMAFVYNFPAPSGSVTATVTAFGLVVPILYTVAVNTGSVGGTVSFMIPPPTGSQITIERTLQLDQQLSLSPYNPFPAKAVERQFDNVVEQVQQVDRSVSDLAAKEALDISNLASGGPGAANLIAPTATGSTTSISLADRFAQVKVVSNFGAVGDGSTDNTLFVQRAVNDCPSTGCTVYFPPPSIGFLIAGNVTVNTPNIHFIGATSRIMMGFTPSGPTGGILFDVTASGVVFDGLWIDGTGASNSVPATINHYAIKFHGTSGAHLANDEVTNCAFTNLPWQDTLGAVVGTHSTYFSWVDGVNVIKNRYDNVNGAAVFLSGVTGFKVLNNRINDTGWYSIHANDVVSQGMVENNRITGTLAGDRVWGGSINFMSNSTTGTACGTPGCATIKSVEVAHNYISGVHSYTSPVHIESSSRISFHDNVIENISLTSAADMLTRYGQHFGSGTNPFYPDGSSPVYIRPYVRPGLGTTNEGPSDHIDISKNILTANGVNNIGIYADAQDNGSGTLGYSDTLVIQGNHVISKDTSNYFSTAIAVHGQQGGWKNVDINHNQVSGFPTSASPVSGLIGCDGNSTGPVLDAIIDHNTVNLLGGTPSTSTHLGIGVARCQRTQVAGNHVNGFWNGIRSLSTASDFMLGINHFVPFAGNVTGSYLLNVAPTVPFGVSNVYGVLPSLTPRQAALAATTVVSLPAAGEYRLCASARTTTSGTGTTGTLQFLWTDEGGAKTDNVGTWALNAVDVTGQINKCEYIHVASGNIQVATTGTFGTSFYTLSSTVEKLN